MRSSFPFFVPLTVVSLAFLTSHSSAEVFGGIDFPQGAASFADKVVQVSPGSPAATNPSYISPNDTLGAPNYASNLGSYSLGRGGSIVLEFTNNALTGSDDVTPDLHVFEIGPDVEDTFVEISKDGVVWDAVGKVFGSTSSIDIDAFGFTSADQFRFVRLTDDPNEGQSSGDTVGADIDAVGAISTNATPDTPLLRIRDAGSTAYQDTVRLHEPVAYWRLNEASGNTAANEGSLGASANGTYGNSVTLNTGGLRAGSLDSALGLPTKSTQGRMLVEGFGLPTHTVTLSLLVRGEDTGNTFILGYGGGGQANEFGIVSNVGLFNVFLNNAYSQFSDVDVLDGTIHHVAFTWTQATGQLNLYVDGSPRGTATATPGTPLTSGGVLALGQDLDNLTPPNYGFDASQSFVGTLDDVAIFDRVLSPLEIAAQAQAALNPPMPAPFAEVFLEFNSALGSVYDIEHSANLSPPPWPTLVGGIQGTGGQMRVPVAADIPKNFFRLKSSVP